MKQIIKRKADCAGTSKINCNLALIFTSEPQKSLSSLLQWERRGTFPLARAGHCGTEGLPVRGGGGTDDDAQGHTDTHRPEAGFGRADGGSCGERRGAERGRARLVCAPRPHRRKRPLRG